MAEIKITIDVPDDLKQVVDNLAAAILEVITLNVKSLEPQGNKPKNITVEDVRAVFLAKNTKENKRELLGILERYGVKKVTELDPSKYAEVLEVLEAL